MPHRLRTWITAGPRLRGVGPSQRTTDVGHVNRDCLRIFLVEIEALLDDGLFICVEWYARNIVTAWVLEEARLDFEHVVFAVAVLIDPFADRITRKGHLRLLRPVAPVGINAPI